MLKRLLAWFRGFLKPKPKIKELPAQGAYRTADKPPDATEQPAPPPPPSPTLEDALSDVTRANLEQIERLTKQIARLEDVNRRLFQKQEKIRERYRKIKVGYHLLVEQVSVTYEAVERARKKKRGSDDA